MVMVIYLYSQFGYLADRKTLVILVSGICLVNLAFGSCLSYYSHFVDSLVTWIFCSYCLYSCPCNCFCREIEVSACRCMTTFGLVFRLYLVYRTFGFYPCLCLVNVVCNQGCLVLIYPGFCNLFDPCIDEVVFVVFDCWV